ncbi:MAG TPA: hypothetical protein ENK18_20940 [Deltaproteobacteria bacterium]|nr:hypothetical protein [Deltaproteobacteria bacterium]
MGWGACSGGPTIPGDAPGSTADTSTEPPELEVACGLQGDNTLRVACTVQLAEPGPVSMSLALPGEPLRTESRDELALQHVISWWDLPPETELSWSASAHDGALTATGTVVTGALPPGADVDFVPVIDGPSHLDRLFFSWACGGYGFLLVTDAAGEVRWYQPFGTAFGTKGIEVSDRGSFLILTNRDLLDEFAYDGTQLLHLSRAEQTLPGPIHHDVASRNGQTLILTARSEILGDELPYIIDGLFEVDGGVDGGVVGEWSLDQVIDPVGLTEPPGAYWFGQLAGIDFGHANSIDVDERGMWLISLKHLDTVMAVVGDPSAPDRGRIAWALVGGERGEPLVQGGQLPSVLQELGDPGVAFEFQHHARWEAPGLITVFDNGRDGLDPSRVLRIRIDEAAGTAELVQSFELGVRCPIQSSGYPLADGSIVATCAENRNVYEFDPDGALRRQVALTCPNGSVSLMVRSIPMSF